MTVLITGGIGVIGAFVTRRLIERGVRPIAYDLRPDMTLVKGLVGQFDFVAGDVLDLPTLLRTIQQFRVDRIIHTAALLAPEAQANPPLAVKVNVEGTVHVLEAARLFGLKRVVFCSSKSAYGNITGEHGHPTYKPYGEDYPCRPVQIYDATKLMAEQLGLNYRRDYGVDFIALRFSAPYGPGRVFHHSKIVTSRMIENAMAGLPLDLPGGGDQINDFVYVKDLAEAVVSACLVNSSEHAIFNIGSGKGMSLRDLAAAVEAVIPGAQLTIGPGLDFLQIGRPIYGVMDISRARRELGYAPKYDFEVGVTDYVATMEQLGLAPSVVHSKSHR